MHIVLRPIQSSDTPNILKWRNAPAVKRHFVFQQDLTAEDHQQWLDTRVASGEVAQFVIRDEGAGQDLGSVYLRDIDPVNRKAEFGIFIGEQAARGKGAGTQAARLILAHGFKKLGLNRIFLRVFADNPGAIKSYEKAGFQKEGLFREDVIIGGTPRDMVFMSVLAKEWDV